MAPGLWQQCRQFFAVTALERLIHLDNQAVPRCGLGEGNRPPKSGHNEGAKKFG